MKYIAIVYYYSLDNVWAQFEADTSKKAYSLADEWLTKEHPNEGAEIHVELEKENSSPYPTRPEPIPQRIGW